MIFTQEQINEIKQRLSLSGIKDSELDKLNLLEHPLTGKEVIVIVKDGENLRISVEDLYEEFAKYIEQSENKEDFFNVSVYLGRLDPEFENAAKPCTLEEAINACPPYIRRAGQMISFLDSHNMKWETYQYIGTESDDWEDGTLFKNRYPVPADEVFDDAQGKKQSVINAEIDTTLTEHKSLINAVTRQNYVTVDSYSDLPNPGAADTIYRVARYDGTQVVDNKYCEYAWLNNAYKLLTVRGYGIDDEPTAGSENVVKSGGIYQYVEGRINDVQTAEIHITDTTGTFSLTPNTFYIFDNIIEEINIVLGTPVSGKFNEYKLEFTCDENSHVNFPNTLRWIDDEPLEPEQGYTYQVSIVDNFAVYGAWEGGQNE